MTFIRNSNDIQLVNIIPDERRYEEELRVAERQASTAAFLESCASSLLVASPGAVVEVRSRVAPARSRAWTIR
ncbi:MAG: hypothetical protein IPL61_32095 [Myxococcales bacterium]|nr:hypothetical protein [Myxococcales bacterium]